MASLTPKEPKSLAERLAILNNVAKKVNEKAGKKIVGFIGKDPEIMEKLRIKFIPTPSIDLTEALGGGWPKSRMTIVSGLSDSGKTSILLETIAKNQKKDPNFIAAWLESENSLQKEYVCNTFGIDPDRFFFIDHERNGAGEGAIDLLESILGAGVIDMAVVNSLKMLVPSEEFKKSLSDHVVGVQARMNARMVRKLTALIAEHETALVVVQHLTTEIGSMSRDPLVLSGGHAIRFAASIIIDMRKRAILDTDPVKKDDAIKVAVTVKKNHCVPDRNPYVKCEYFAVFGQGVEQYLTLINKCVENGILLKSGSFIRDPDDNGDAKVVDDVKYQWQGSGKLRDYLIENPSYFEELQARLGGNFVQQLTSEEIEQIQKEEERVEKAAKSSKSDSKKSAK